LETKILLIMAVYITIIGYFVYVIWQRGKGNFEVNDKYLKYGLTIIVSLTTAWYIYMTDLTTNLKEFEKEIFEYKKENLLNKGKVKDIVTIRIEKLKETNNKLMELISGITTSFSYLIIFCLIVLGWMLKKEIRYIENNNI